MTLSPRLAFLAASGPLDFGRRLGRLRWQRATRAREVRELSPSDSAGEAFGPEGAWVVVLDDRALPLCSGRLPEPGQGVLMARPRLFGDPPFPHTLRELEESLSAPGREGSAGPGATAALIFDVAALPPAPGETVEAFLGRLRGSGRAASGAGFDALLLPAAFGPRPEITRHVPGTARRLLDVGCADAEASAALRRRSPDVLVWGIERDPALAELARPRLDRLLVGEARAVLAGLSRDGARFDAFLFADVLEHLEDPIEALSQAKSLAEPGATLVASVPNVGHLSIVRDLLLGRFDPVPAGLFDAGHLRWFTRKTLRDVLEASGWSVQSVEGLAGAPASRAEEFLRWAATFPGADRDGLQTYQWIAVARA